MIFNSDMFGMFNVPDDRKAAQVALATATMSKSFQSAFNVVKGSVPARTDVPDTDFDACGKKGIADLKAANEGGTLFGSLAQGYGAPPAVANAYKDVVIEVRPRPDQDLGRGRRPNSSRRSTTPSKARAGRRGASPPGGRTRPSRNGDRPALAGLASRGTTIDDGDCRAGSR